MYNTVRKKGSLQLNNLSGVIILTSLAVPPLVTVNPGALPLEIATPMCMSKHPHFYVSRHPTVLAC